MQDCWVEEPAARPHPDRLVTSLDTLAAGSAECELASDRELGQGYIEMDRSAAAGPEDSLPRHLGATQTQSTYWAHYKLVKGTPTAVTELGEKQSSDETLTSYWRPATEETEDVNLNP